MSVRVVEVAIIGAGVSGLKAGTTLLELGKVADNIVIIEAEDRVGGRLKTDRTSSKIGLHYDLGASWFHDALTNDVLQQSLDDGSLNWTQDVYFDDKDPSCYDELGQIDVVGLKLNRVYEELEKFVEVYFFDSIETGDISLQQVSQLYFEKYSSRLTTHQTKYVAKMIRMFELWYGISYDSISGKYAIMDHQGRNLFNIKGYDYLINKLTEKMESLIITGSRVIEINRRCKLSEPGKILLNTSNGTKIYCNNLIVTVPLSVLQLPASEGISWIPALPTNITDSLKTVHFGALGKVIFEFNEIWWDENEDRFEIFDNGKHENLSESLTKLPKPFSYPAYIINMASKHRPRRGAALLILTQAPLTNYLEAHPEQAWDYFKPMLAKLEVKGKTCTDPINVITTDWTTKPTFGGSYTSLHTNDDPSDLIIQLCGEYSGVGLLDTNIRFAGEHTILDGAGCVHGAYASGERAANLILQNY